MSKTINYTQGDVTYTRSEWSDRDGDFWQSDEPHEVTVGTVRYIFDKLFACTQSYREGSTFFKHSYKLDWESTDRLCKSGPQPPEEEGI